MKKHIIKSVSIVIALIMAFSSSVIAAGGASAPRAPEGYDQHDYEKVSAFLEQADIYGVTNGVKISPAYDPLDPESWNVSAERFTWTEIGGVLRLESVNCASVSGRLSGPLDLSGCTALVSVDVSGSALTSADLSGCTVLDSLVCKNNLLESLNVDGCSSLRLLNCAGNDISALSVRDCPVLRFLECRWNRIASLDLSGNPELTVLICTDNCLKTLDLSHNPLLGCVSFLRMVDAGGQYISCFIARDPEYSNMNEFFISADCYDSCDSFEGWFTVDGRRVSDHTTYSPQPADGGSFVARFVITGPMPGDADGDGSVTVSDALLILRKSMSLIAGNTGAGFDVDGDGTVTVTDALLVLRRCMGLFGN